MTAEPLNITSTLLAGDPAELATGVLPILLAGPSLGTSVEAVWGPAIAHLERDFLVIGWDLPGHGRSEPTVAPFTMEELADAVEASLARLIKEHHVPATTPIMAAGVSIAGAVALTLALRKDTRINRLSAVCTAAKIGTPESWAERAELVERAGTPTMVEGAAARWFAPGFMSRKPAVSTAILSSLQYTDRHSYAHACHALGGYDLTGEMKNLARPLLLIHGAEDPVCSPAEADAIVNTCSAGADVRAVTLDSVAHLAPAEAPEETARLLVEFLNA